ncbi:MAG: hypothetical protein ACXVA9_13145, partial [Bdellovibrionales bacterium]
MRNLLLISMVLIALGSFQNCSNAAFSAADSSNVATGTPGGDDASGELFQTLNFLQPAMAVRSANCINCHGNTMASTLITDFGFGDNYFFGKDNATPLTGDPVYSLRIDKDAGAFKPYWAEAQQYTNGAKIIVPKANLGFQYST